MDNWPICPFHRIKYSAKPQHSGNKCICSDYGADHYLYDRMG